MEWLRAHAYRLLRWSEKYTKTDMVYAASGGFWLGIGQATSAALSFVLAISFANLVTAEQYGNYKYVLSLAGLLGALTLTGLGTAVTRATAHGDEGTLRHAYRMSLIWSGGMVLCAGLGGAYYLWNENFFLGISLLAIGVASPFMASASLYRPFLLGKKEFKLAALYGAVQALVPALFVLGGLFLKVDILVLVILYFASNAFTLLLLFKKTIRLATNNKRDERTKNLSKHVSLMNVFSTATGKLDSILIFQLMGGAELAIFAFATAIPDTIRGSLKSISSLAMPKFAQKTKLEIGNTIGQKGGLITLITLCIALAYFFSAPLLFKFFFPAYSSAVPYSQAYAMIIVLNAFLATAFLDAGVLIKEKYFLNILVNSSAIILIFCGVYFFGIWGAIWARIASRLISAVAAWVVVSKNLPKKEIRSL